MNRHFYDLYLRKEEIWLDPSYKPCPTAFIKVLDDPTLREIGYEIFDSTGRVYSNCYLSLYETGSHTNPQHRDFANDDVLPIERDLCFYSLGDTRDIVYRGGDEEVGRFTLNNESIYVPDEEFHWDKGYTHGIEEEEDKGPRIGIIFFNWVKK